MLQKPLLRASPDWDLGIQNLKRLPVCLIDPSVIKALGKRTTAQGLLELANEYLGYKWRRDILDYHSHGAYC